MTGEPSTAIETAEFVAAYPVTGQRALQGQQTVGAFRVARVNGARLGDGGGNGGGNGGNGGGVGGDDVAGGEGELHYLLVFSSSDYKDHSVKSWVLRITTADLPHGATATSTSTSTDSHGATASTSSTTFRSITYPDGAATARAADEATTPWWPIETAVVMETILDASTCASNIVKRDLLAVRLATDDDIDAVGEIEKMATPAGLRWLGHNASAYIDAGVASVTPRLFTGERRTLPGGGLELRGSTAASSLVLLTLTRGARAS
jgi:hypothetical protein